MGLLTPKLTTPQGEELALQQASTFNWMAHWAMSGPAGKTCRECSFWANSKKYKRDCDGELSARRCRRFRQMSQGRNGPGVPHAASACKYFAEAEKPPTAFPARKEAQS